MTQLQNLKSLNKSSARVATFAAKQIVFLKWALFVTRKTKDSYALEMVLAKERGGDKPTSIWKMNKSELVHVARAELSMALAEADGKTVVVLRELIRNNREKTKASQDVHERIPPGLEKMKLAEMLVECKARALPEIEKPTRPRLIQMIRDDVDMRLGMVHSLESSRRTADDWIMGEVVTELPRKSSDVLQLADVSSNEHEQRCSAR